MGEVYRARDLRLDRTVAIKVLPPDLSANPVLRERFEREAKIVALLHHPHICALFDVGREGDLEFLVMEYLEGETLEARLKSRPLPLAEILSIGIDVADALDKAHREGVIHRDLKPANVMLTESGIKLLDFGIATITQPPSDKTPSNDTPTTDHGVITTGGQVLGTTSYMSPEQARGQPLDPRTDIWSLSVMLYRMISGRLPFEGPTVSDVISLILLKEPEPPMSEHLEVPPWLAELVMKGLEKDRERRYPSARQILSDLQRFKQKQEIEAEIQRLENAWGAPEAPASGVSGQTSAPARPDQAIPAPARAPAPPTGSLFDAIRAHPTAWLIGACAAITVGLAFFSLAFAGVFAAASAGALGATAYFSRSDSIAVMPFEWTGTGPLSGPDPEREYLADGITEGLIQALSQMDNLKVISRTSVFRYKGREFDLSRVRRELAVRRVLTGRILRRGAAVAVSVELVDAADGKHVWGEQYERPIQGLADLPRDITAQVSQRLRAPGARHIRGRAYSPSDTGYRAYLKGKFYWNKRKEDDIQKAIECFHEAVASDPGYALAYVGLAECYIVLGLYSTLPLRDAYSQAKRVALKALEIDDALAEAHAALAVIKAGDEWDLQGALREFARALEINPNYATAHQWYAEHLVCAGRKAAALAEIKLAQDLDPLSFAISVARGQILVLAREYDQAIDQLNVALKIDSKHYMAHRVLRDAYLEKGRMEDAIAEHLEALRLAGENPARVEAVGSALRQALESGGPKGYWQRRLEITTQDLQAPSRLPYDVTDISPYHVAGIYARLGYRDLAAKWVEKAFEERDYGIYYLKANPAFDALLTEPRIAAVLRRIGLSA